jgi:hypothetical protein
VDRLTYHTFGAMRESSSAAGHLTRSRLHTSRRELLVYALGTWTRGVGIVGESQSWKPLVAFCQRGSDRNIGTANAHEGNCDCKYSKLDSCHGCTKNHDRGCCTIEEIVTSGGEVRILKVYELPQSSQFLRWRGEADETQ